MVDIGYHFTTLTNWRSIQEHGMKPALITDLSFSNDASEYKGIWFWQNQLEGEHLLGMLISILGAKRSWGVCELKVDLTGLTHLLPQDAFSLDAWTSINIGDWKFIEHKPTWIITDTIQSERIKLNRIWKLND